ncbi:MAG: glycosyltransferase [Proteobacteria bacterium]|nr:glycosyltransferase [Pseudomonadota bacterium]
MLLAFAIAALLLAAIPALLFLRNLQLYTPPPVVAAGFKPAVSVLIPARNEEAVIARAVRAALASRNVDLEVIVLDDHSADRTAEIVAQIAAEDPRVSVHTAPALPPGWSGKQHACAALARLATKPTLCFVDADVELHPDAVSRLAAFQSVSKSALVSGFPRQQTVTFLEQLLLPLMHFVLLGFLPVSRMRMSTAPSYSAGCGQLFLADRASYEAAGGHSAIHASLHDGIALPRAFRQAGFATDLCDMAGLASCRMYHNAAEVWAGLSKNATEGLAAPKRIVPITALLFIGQVLPLAILAGSAALSATFLIAAVAAVFAYLPRVAGRTRFGHTWLSVALHPLGIAVLLILQWYALVRSLTGGPAQWKGRSYHATPA